MDNAAIEGIFRKPADEGKPAETVSLRFGFVRKFHLNKYTTVAFGKILAWTKH